MSGTTGLKPAKEHFNHDGIAGDQVAARADRNRVGVICGTITIENVGTLVGHVGDFQVNRGRQLVLERKRSTHPRSAAPVWSGRMRGSHDSLGPLQRQEATGRYAARKGNGSGASIRRNAGPAERKCKDRNVLVGVERIDGGGLDGLIRQNRQVLSDDVAEVGAEHADVEAATVAQAQLRFWE